MKPQMATPPLVARRRSADRRHNDSTRTPASWTPRAARHRSSPVGRRAETRPNPRGASRKRRQKGDGGTFGTAFSPIIDARKRPRSRRPSRVRRFQLIPRTARQPRVVREVRVDVAPPTRESRNHAGFRALEWRDPDSNRGHHDFQSCALPTELSRQRARRLARTRCSFPAQAPSTTRVLWRAVIAH
jgi:hypothetical protein